jgi:hypothetical protein
MRGARSPSPQKHGNLQDIGFGILVVTHAMAIVEVMFYRVFHRVVKKRKSQLTRNWEISLALWG